MDTRKKLLDSTIQVVAAEGLENTTTKRIASYAAINEVTLFRIYKGKNNLLRKTFQYAQEQICAAVLQNLPILQSSSLSMEKRHHRLFVLCWEWLLAHPDICRFYLRFYHSSYYTADMEILNSRELEIISRQLHDSLGGVSDIETKQFLLPHVLEIMLTFVVRIDNGQLHNTTQTAASIFHLAHSTLTQAVLY